MRLPWIKFWFGEWLDNGLSVGLSNAQYGVAVKLWAIAGRSGDPGTIPMPRGKKLDLSLLARRCRCKPALLSSTLTLLEEQGKIMVDQAGIHWPFFMDDQTIPVKETKERKAAGASSVTGHQVSKTQAEEDTVHIPITPAEKEAAEASKARIAAGIKKLAAEKKL